MTEWSMTMQLYYAVGDDLWSEAQIRAGDITLAPDRTRGLMPSAAETPRSGNGFASIGVGKPLTLEIREIYTGEKPRRKAFGSTSMLITSAIKPTIDPQPAYRALNILTDDTLARTPINTPGATEYGTPILYYSPAVLDRRLTLTVEIFFDTFDGKFLDSIGGLLQTAGGLPIFATYGTLLLGAGQAVKIASRGLEALLDPKKAEINTVVDIVIDYVGKDPTSAGFMFIKPDEFDGIFHTDSGHVTDRAGNPYRGDHPYMVLSADGNTRDDLANFSPLAASAEVLTRFLGEDQTAPVDTLVEALKLYNDFNFRVKVERLDRQIAGMAADNPLRAERIAERDALVANIQTELLRPG
jgi:hypothetical protein